jgi:hypothetical protein
MILISDSTTADLEQMAAQHFAFLNPIVLPKPGQLQGDYAPGSLIGRIRSSRLDAIAINATRQVAFWDYLMANHQSVLYDLITGRPKRLKQLIKDIHRLFPISMFCSGQTYDSSTLTNFGQKVKHTFSYKTKYRNQQECVENFINIKFGYCPYCNLLPVDVTGYPVNGSSQEKLQALHQLDHFYPQSRHPYLAVSFFNLIPGCSPCNAQLKLEKRFDIDTHFNPFHNRLDDEFEFRSSTLIPQNLTELTFTAVLKPGRNYSDKALNDFNLMDRYTRNHQLPVYNMINYLRLHGPAILASQMRQIPGLYVNQLEAHENLLRATGVPVLQNEILKYPLGKLKRDICAKMQML